MPLMQSLRRYLAALLLLAATGTAWAQPSSVPVHSDNFPDPFIVAHAGNYLAYSTNSDGVNLPMLVSRDLVGWTEIRHPETPDKRLDAMPALAPWVKEGRTWAPEVMEIGGRWLLYYTAHHRKKDVQCIGVASAGNPRGPFTDSSAEPLVCQHDLGGTIDAHPFRDADGQLYLYYKNDGNNPAFLKPSQVWAQRLSSDGLHLTGEAAPLIRNDKHWEWRVVEAPAMVRHEDGYTLFFSANHFGWEADQRLSNYGTGYAQCQGPMGPCVDAPENPWLRSFNEPRAGCLSGPGHPAVFNVEGRQFMAFHAWAANSSCRKAADERYLYIAPLHWREGKPVLAPSLRPAPGPGERG